MEALFEIAYLITVITLGILILRNANGRKQFTLFGIMAIVLGCGDAFHLVPRIYASITNRFLALTAPLGFGKLVTSITMTVFYIILYHVYCVRYNKHNKKLTLSLYALAALRIGLCLMPQNRWLYADAPLTFGIYRNIPFAVMGLIIIILFMLRAKEDKPFKWMFLAIALSFMFYIPVVLWADAYPIIGMLMIPKTCAYIWIVCMGYNASKMKGNE